jgi:TPR repeat protein
LDDVSLQLAALERGLKNHFDSVEVVRNLEAEQLRQKLSGFLRDYGNDSDARLFIYYAGHGYTEIIQQRNENRGYITGVDTPVIDGTARSYDAARRKSISMTEIRAPLGDALAKHVLFVFDSCFAGTIFTTRAVDPQRPLTPDVVANLVDKPSREFITAGRANERVPANSPISGLLLAALSGAADRYQHGVISAAEINQYMRDQVLPLRINLTPQQGRLPDPAFAEGEFLFRVVPATATVSAQPDRLPQLNYSPAEQFNRARAYENGLGGLSKDDREAVRLYKLAADQGYAPAQSSLAFMYGSGLGGLSKDEREAVRLYKLAADQGNAFAQVNLGFMYEKGGGGLVKDEREAARHYKLAADQGNADAQFGLGRFYDQGRGGLSKDEREAVRLYKLAADQGLTFAQDALKHLDALKQLRVPR